jgi:hypothetical protein
MANLNGQKKYHFIYKTTNLKNGKFYVGMHSTNNLNDGYLGSGKRLRRSINKNGVENFNIEYLEFFDNRIDLVNREKELINEELLKDPMCMNLKPGGEGGFMNEIHREKFFKIALSDNIDKKRSKKGALITHTKRKNDLDFDKKWRESLSKGLKGNTIWLGKKHTEETKRKISEKLKLRSKGENNSQFGTYWITNGVENKKIKKSEPILNGWVKGRVTK